MLVILKISNSLSDFIMTAFEQRAVGTTWLKDMGFPIESVLIEIDWLILNDFTTSIITSSHLTTAFLTTSDEEFVVTEDKNYNKQAIIIAAR